MRNVIIGSLVGGLCLYLIMAFTGYRTPLEAAGKAGIWTLMMFIGFSLWLFVRWLWRLIRGIKPTGLARGAGALTGAAHRRSSNFLQAFKAGYNGDDSSR